MLIGYARVSTPRPRSREWQTPGPVGERPGRSPCPAGGSVSLRSALQGHKVYLDANIFIYVLEDVSPWVNPLQGVFSGLEAGEWITVTSRLSLAECLVRPFAMGRGLGLFVK